MKISPVSIKRQEFQKALRGYEPQEVRVYLDRLADDVEKLVTELDSLKKENDELRESLADFKKIESEYKQTLLKANESAKSTLDSAKAEAEKMIREAEENFEVRNKEHIAIQKTLEADIAVLAKRKDELLSELIKIVKEQGELAGVNTSDIPQQKFYEDDIIPGTERYFPTKINPDPEEK